MTVDSPIHSERSQNTVADGKAPQKPNIFRRFFRREENSRETLEEMKDGEVDLLDSIKRIRSVFDTYPDDYKSEAIEKELIRGIPSKLGDLGLQISRGGVAMLTIRDDHAFKGTIGGALGHKKDEYLREVDKRLGTDKRDPILMDELRSFENDYKPRIYGTSFPGVYRFTQTSTLNGERITSDHIVLAHGKSELKRISGRLPFMGSDASLPGQKGIVYGSVQTGVVFPRR